MLRHSLFLLGLILPIFNCLTISQYGIQGSDGETEEQPVHVEDEFTLECGLSLNANEDWFYCAWSHVVEDIENSDGQPAKVICGVSDYMSDNGRYCANKGDSELDSYEQRITMVLGQSSCGIRVDNAEPTDSGDWTCKVVGNGGAETQQTIEVFVANMSTLYITDPDLEEDSRATIEYDLEDTRSEIEATCRAYGGRPAPEFHWYLDDEDVEIEKSDLTTRVREGRDAILGEYTEETISWQPTLDSLCEDYDLDQEACERNKNKYRFFNMNLMCKVEQGDYFVEENDDNMAEVIIEVISGAPSLKISGMLSLVMMAAFTSKMYL